MFILRLTQTTEGMGKFHIEIAFEGDGLSRKTATSSFDFKLTGQDQEDLRWYFEDFLQYPYDPAPKIAERIEKRITEIGVQLFKALFQSSDDARDMWAKLRDHLNDTRIEIVTEVQEATTIPWELIRDPKTDTPLALRARAFVRTHPQAAQSPQIPKTDGEIRILLAICRPRGKEDVPFRSVASRLIKALSEEAHAKLRLDVLRPPTFEQLGRVLRAAKAEGQPYHVIHFDGHGTYADTRELAALPEKMKPVMVSTPRPGAHGYIVFENPKLGDNMQYVDGPSLGKLLTETDVPVLVLNACRSAHADPKSTPVSGDFEDDDPHARVRTLGSLAQEVMEAGVAGVVAMRYNVYVITAAKFVNDLYRSLIQGNALGEAVTLGRKQLATDPLREIADQPVRLQDWSVPVVYEAVHIALFPKKVEADKLVISLREGQATPALSGLDPNLPKSPDAGFFGRDETIMALDRAFDTQPIVLLHAYAGNGKTATAAEFARWYALTGGIQGPVLFTSFEQYKPLTHLLDQFGQVFEKAIEQSGVHWLALDDKSQREVALQVLKQIQVLWILDNVEPIAGFPKGTKSAWNEAEQKGLVDFLRDARETKAKFLLTSRRDEHELLGDLPLRIKVPPMPLQERVQLARALAEKHGHRLSEVEDWRPLLEFTQGNPLTITVIVGEALYEGLKTKEQIETFVSKLRAGEAAFEDELKEGRSKSLGASLSYGFNHAFDEEEKKQLALLHLFQDFVEVDALRLMGEPQSEWYLSEICSLTRDAGIVLLDRAAEIGLLNSLDSGYYNIHPVLPWFFKSLFDQYYASAGREMKAIRVFVETISRLGNYHRNQYEHGRREVITILALEEANLLYARIFARRNRWWKNLIGTMEGLFGLYYYSGRKVEWIRLVDEIVPDFVDPATDGPLPGLEEYWEKVTEYRGIIAEEARQLGEAEHLHQLRIDWASKECKLFLETPPEKLDYVQRKKIQRLASSLQDLAEIQRKLGNPDCVASYENCLTLTEKVGERVGTASILLNLGTAYKNIPIIRDLEKSESCYKRSLDLTDESDSLGIGHCLNQLGIIAWEYFKEAQEAKKPKKEQRSYLDSALKLCNQALEIVPSYSVDSMAIIHNQLGIIYYDAGDLPNAVNNYHESIRYSEMQGNLYMAASIRKNTAVALSAAGQFDDALDYANAALRNFGTYGERAMKEIQQTRELIAEIEHDIKTKGDNV